MRLAPGLVLERVGEDLLVIVPERSDVVRLSGLAAGIVHDVASGKLVSDDSPVAPELMSLGILTGSRMSRRGLLKAGAIGATTGIAFMAMPGLAVASSTNWIEIRGWSDDYSGGEWGFEIGNYRDADGNNVLGSGTPMSAGIPNPPPTTDINDVSDLSLSVGSAPPVLLPVDYDQLTDSTSPPTFFIGWYKPGEILPLGPSDVAIGEFTWNTPDGILNYRVTFRNLWTGFA